MYATGVEARDKMQASFIIAHCVRPDDIPATNQLYSEPMIDI